MVAEATKRIRGLFEFAAWPCREPSGRFDLRGMLC